MADDSYLFIVDGISVIMDRSNKCNRGVYYMLYPYFGGDEKAPHEIDITISKTSDKFFGSRSNHISIIGGIIDESRSEFDNIVNRIEGSKIILSPDVYTLKVKTRGIPTINSSPISTHVVIVILFLIP